MPDIEKHTKPHCTGKLLFERKLQSLKNFRQGLMNTPVYREGGANRHRVVMQ